MHTDYPNPGFDDLADIYWRLGVMQSPSQLQGFLVGQLAAGAQLDLAHWPQQASRYIDSVEPPNKAESQLLSGLCAATGAQLRDEGMGLQLLLPDDGVEINQRVDSLGQWCHGFLAGFAEVGKHIQQQQGQQQYSSEASEALSDIAAISQIGLGGEDTEEEERERSFFEISEYLRLAAITIYLECTNKSNTVDKAPTAPSDAADVAVSSPADLFKSKSTKKKLH